MITSKRQFIDEQTSPLHRIMWLYNPSEPKRRSFENNICAFHVGNGYFLSVAHNLRVPAGYFKSIDLDLYQKELLYKIDGAQKMFLDQHYFTDDYTRKMYLNNVDQAGLNGIASILKQKRFDTRWEAMAQKKICTPHLVIQFRNGNFYDDPDLTPLIPAERVVYEPEAGKYSFLVEVELVKAFYSADIALYRIINTTREIIDRIPAVDINTDFLEETPEKMHCVQSAPNSPVGRLLNDAHIEGMLDHFELLHDETGGNYTMDGFRYLVKGYFRFGSSGAPYVFFDQARGRYVVNAVQSEASGIHMSIRNDKEGNFQYTNAIVSPLYIIRHELAALGVW